MIRGYSINAEDLIGLRLEFYSYSMGIVDNKENEEYIWDRNRMDEWKTPYAYLYITCPNMDMSAGGCFCCWLSI